jgi:hypothetical protein
MQHHLFFFKAIRKIGKILADFKNAQKILTEIASQKISEQRTAYSCKK